MTDSAPENGTILIIDDSPRNLQLLGNVLRNDGYEISFSQDGVHALSIIDEVKPDLILLDIMMPGLDGYAVCKKIKNNPNHANIPIIFITAKSELEDLVKGFDTGAVDYITKPFQSKELRSRVRTHISLKKANDVIIAQKTELEFLNQQKSRFFSIIAHDLRSPFNSLLSLLYLVNMHPREQFPGKIYDLLLETEKSTKALFGLLENLLQWANLQMGRQQFEFCTFSLQETIEKGKELFLSLAAQKNISLKWQGDYNINVHTDPEALYTILRNIIANAIKYSPENKSVEISCKNSNHNQAIICVQDQGIGMNPTQISNLFRPEAKYSVVGTKGEKGSGIGLILCHELAEKTGLKIEVSSQVNQGSCFCLHIPTANNA